MAILGVAGGLAVYRRKRAVFKESCARSSLNARVDSADSVSSCPSDEGVQGPCARDQERREWIGSAVRGSSKTQLKGKAKILGRQKIRRG
ncbi:hypothetical protein OnM2_039044 [Erysiphe neolycopersici]|uniref:Uncharacterized protein n=1 Tax=Erysiphe neolycopersici TaxID=212602 RepID=A0A420HW61_9PEZI|nr:hypothetical protein OnM2_039044 [Erysiphe neolycopersici]